MRQKKYKNHEKTHMYSKVIYLILIAGLEWGAVTCSKGGAGTGSVTAPVDINSCSDETLIADPGGKYYNYCDNPITLNGQDSCAKAGVENIQWNFGENYKGVSGVKTLTPTLSYSCVQGGSGKERYDILLTIRDALGQQASGGTVIILDEKGLLQFASDTAQAKEGSGAIAVEMNVSNHNQAKRFTLNNIGGFPPMTVDYFTVDGTATAPGDYQAIEGTLSFAYGEKSKTLSIPIINDSEYEGDEYFFLKLKNSTNATIEDVQIMCVISDPDPEPTATPTVEPTATPTVEPTATPTVEPTATPTVEPTATPTVEPTATPTPVHYTVTASYTTSSCSGSVSPTGSLSSLSAGDSVLFTISCGSCYSYDVQLDGSSVYSDYCSGSDSYTLSNINADHSIVFDLLY